MGAVCKLEDNPEPQCRKRSSSDFPNSGIAVGGSGMQSGGKDRISGIEKAVRGSPQSRNVGVWERFVTAIKNRHYP